MKTTNFIMTFLVLIISSQTFGRSMHPRKTKFSFQKNNKKICEMNRVTPGSYINVYGAVKERFLKFKLKNPNLKSINQWKLFIEQEQGGVLSENCSFSVFTVTRFLLYFDQLEYLFESYDELAFLKYRDELHEKWINELNKNTFNLDKKEKLELSEMNLKFNDHGMLRKITAVINRKPKVNSEFGKAVNDVHDLLGAKSIFNAIFTEYSKKYFYNKEFKNNVSCFRKELDNAKGKNIHEITSICGLSKKTLLNILGVFGSQGIYFVKDYYKQIYLHSSREDFETFRHIVAETSYIYLKLETYGNEYGVENLYPEVLVNEVQSLKPYHFYSVAFIASYLKDKGYDEKVIKSASTYYAKKYKKI